MNKSNFKGSVTSGHGRGKIFTFPTINLEGEASVGDGVYIVRAKFSGQIYSGVMHVGPCPTFHESDFSIEIHLLDFVDEKVSGQVEVEVLDRIRDVQEFDSPEALKKQIEQDIMQAHEYFKTKK